MICAECGGEFYGNGHGQKLCSDRCRKKRKKRQNLENDRRRTREIYRMPEVHWSRLDGKKLHEIGEAIGTSRQAVQQLLARALYRYKRRFLRMAGDYFDPSNTPQVFAHRGADGVWRNP